MSAELSVMFFFPLLSSSYSRRRNHESGGEVEDEKIPTHSSTYERVCVFVGNFPCWIFLINIKRITIAEAA